MSPGRLDVDAESRRVLEYDAALELVAGHAVTPLGRAAVLSLEPVADAHRIADELAAVAETVQHLRDEGRCVSGGVPDPAAALSALAVEDLAVGARELRDLASVLIVADDAARALTKAAAGQYPRLGALAAALPRLASVARPVLEHTAPDGKLLDGASNALRQVRVRIARVGERLRSMLQRMMHDPDTQPSIRDDFITQRNGRFVIPVRTDAPRPVRGIVHAASSSGATMFVEPLPSVELNNELVQLAEREQEEEERILRGWADGFRARRDEVRAAVDGVGRLDGLQARALYADREGAVAPVVDAEGGWRLAGLRHPLLDRKLREEGGRVVPLDLVQASDDRLLVLSGPNTGGKTVALKTLGLSVLMAHAGLPVAASSVRLPLFRQVRADIGDHQSIEASLSTYSAHVRAVAEFLSDVEPPALFLFDEIGGGTEPGEGAALAQAVLERLLGDGVDTVVTTHQNALKAWAVSTPGVLSAAMEFDVDRLRPTYRVIPGAAGVSAGLDIASRLDLPARVIERARELLGPDARRTEDYLDRIRDLLAELERRREEAARAETELVGERERLERTSRAAEERRRREAEQVLERALEELRRLGRREVRAVRDTAARPRVIKRQERAEARLRMEVERRKAEMAASGDTDAAPASAKPVSEVGAGDRVLIRSLGRQGVVESVRGKRVRVRMGTTTFTVPTDDLAEASGEVPGPARDRAPRRPSPDPPDDAASELHLIGKTVDEALPELDRFLDRAVLQGRGEVRVVHGHGTGRLRSAVRRFLGEHPLVDSHRAGGKGEGGDGATVARLR